MIGNSKLVVIFEEFQSQNAILIMAFFIKKLLKLQIYLHVSFTFHKKMKIKDITFTKH